ncbi:AAA family ATPase [Glycomyces sp. TRM65418]|uniref:AAA family ATPase n=1 Tax=Glycomyces sp. TRM65418 TaxID=2867006 RepID=UPI001CE61B2C|nr:AAA family ATPase [Glycomyces sp. TRM65418]MCC3763103.1 AAA family ATPase [Glycomyces sp. TRM65418]QZD57111.1 AAA family ATPase [Glycomyces sp. TRM65418]
MRRVLITGVSGVGKSTVIAALGARGHRVVDTDYGGYCSPAPDAEPPRPTAEPGWVWHEARMRRLLDTAEGRALFVSGCVPNQGRFYADFDRVVLLSAAPEVVRRRLLGREGNDYGKASGELEQALRDQAAVEPLLRAGATLEIDTDAPLADVVDRLIAHAFG